MARKTGGFSVLDGVALVMGAAVASVHARGATPDPETAGAMGWAWLTLVFCWISTTASGPFLYVARRFRSGPVDGPRAGDRLWAIAGSPWCVAALVRAGEGHVGVVPGRDDPSYLAVLGIGLAIAALATTAILASRYLLVPPSCALAAGPEPWTHRVGLVLAIAWPIQFGVGLLMLD